MWRARTKRKIRPKYKAQLQDRKAASKNDYNGEGDMIFPADEVKVREEEKNKIVVRSDQAGPC